MNKTSNVKIIWTLCLILVPLLPSLLIFGMTQKRLHHWQTIDVQALEVGALVAKDNLKKNKNAVLTEQSRHADPLYLSKEMPKLKLCQQEIHQLESLILSPDFISDSTVENRLKMLMHNNIFRFQLKDDVVGEVRIFQSNVLQMDENDISNVLSLLDNQKNDKPLFFISKWNMLRKSTEGGHENWEVQLEVIQREV